MIKVGMKVKLPVEKIEVTITHVSQDGSKIRYEGDNGERGVLLTEKLNAWQVFEVEEAEGRSIMEMIEERFSNFNIVIKSKTAHNFLKMTCNEIRHMSHGETSYLANGFTVGVTTYQNGNARVVVYK